MFAQFCRRVVGGVRLFLTLVALALGGAVVIADICGVNVSGATYTFLGAMLAQVIVYQALETKRKSGDK